MTLTTEQRNTLRELASGAACPAGVASLLDRIAAGHAVQAADVTICTGTRDESANFYARLRAAGVQLVNGGVLLRAESGADPRAPIAFEAVRPDVQRTARVLADTMDGAALMVRDADREYARALGW